MSLASRRLLALGTTLSKAVRALDAGFKGMVPRGLGACPIPVRTINVSDDPLASAFPVGPEQAHRFVAVDQAEQPRVAHTLRIGPHRAADGRRDLVAML